MIRTNKNRPIRFEIKVLIINLLPEFRNNYHYTSGLDRAPVLFADYLIVPRHAKADELLTTVLCSLRGTHFSCHGQQFHGMTSLHCISF